MILWFDKWNPWALHSHIRYLEAKIAQQKGQISSLWNDKDDYVKRIETLESKLQSKEGELQVQASASKYYSERATFNLQEKEKALSAMRMEIYAAIGLLKEVAKEG